MNHLSYYDYQAKARNITSLRDVISTTRDKAYIYDRIVAPWLGSDRNCRVAELACGHGSFLFWLKENGFVHTTGIDSSAAQIGYARQVQSAVMMAEVIPWLTNQSAEAYDVFIAIDLIEHISKDDFMELLSQSARVLKNHGKLILRYPNGDSPLVGRNLFNDITHVWTYTTNAMDTLARMHGFSGVTFEDESLAAIRDHRWIKVPLARLATLTLRFLFQAASKEKVRFWSPHIWACLQKQGPS